MIPYTLKPCEVNVSNTIQKRITIIKTTGHESSSKSFCTIQIKVTTNINQSINQISKAPISAADPPYGKSMRYRLQKYVSGR